MNNKDIFEKAPLDTPIYIIDEYHNIYVGTLFKKCTFFLGENFNNIYRGECLEGNSELFYRNALVDWAVLPENLIPYYKIKRFKNMSNIEKILDSERAQRVVSETLYNNAINFSWFFEYLDKHFPHKTASSGYNALTQMFFEYNRDLEKQFEKK